MAVDSGRASGAAPSCCTSITPMPTRGRSPRRPLPLFRLPFEGRARQAKRCPTADLIQVNFSAGAAPGDSRSAYAAACENAARAEAARCGVGHRSYCKFPAASPARGASGRGRDIRGSNTGPSSRADIASLPRSSSVEFVEQEKRPENQRDCAPVLLVCQGESLLLVEVLFQGGADGNFRANSRGGDYWLTVTVSESGLCAGWFCAGAAGCAAGAV